MRCWSLVDNTHEYKPLCQHSELYLQRWSQLKHWYREVQVRKRQNLKSPSLLDLLSMSLSMNLLQSPESVVPLFAEEPGADFTVFFEFFEATAPPIPPPTAATMATPTTMQIIKNIFVKPQYLLSGGGRGASCFSSFGGIALE
jgi:hypothetical protein